VRLSAIDALHRGVLATLANWPLVVVQLAVGLLAFALLLAGFVPPLVVLGATAAFFALFRPGAESDPSAVGRLFGDLAERAGGALVPLMLALLASMLFWFLAFLVYSWGFAGGLGVLAAADRQAPPGSGQMAVFRTYSWRYFAELGGGGLWRTFWFLNLAGALITLPVIAGLALFLPIGLFAANEQVGAAAALGCGGFTVLALLFVVLCAWVGVAIGDLPRPDGGAVAALATGWRVLWRRLGAVLLVYLVYLAVAFGIGGVAFGFQLLAELVGRQSTVAGLLLWGGVSLVQAVISGALSLVLSGAMIALVADQRAEERGVAASGGWLQAGPSVAVAAVPGWAPAAPPPVASGAELEAGGQSSPPEVAPGSLDDAASAPAADAGGAGGSPVVPPEVPSGGAK
jgi:hypothetical protein